MSEPGELMKAVLAGWLANWRWGRQSLQAAEAGRRIIAGGRGLETETDGPLGYDEGQLGLLLGVGAVDRRAEKRAGRVGNLAAAGSRAGKPAGLREPGRLSAGLRGESDVSIDDGADIGERRGGQAAFVAAAKRAKQIWQEAGESGVAFYGGIGESEVSVLTAAELAAADYPAGDDKAGAGVGLTVEPVTLARSWGLWPSIGENVALAAGIAEPEALSEKKVFDRGSNDSLNNGLNEGWKRDLNGERVGEEQLAGLLLPEWTVAAGRNSRRSQNEPDGEEFGLAPAGRGLPAEAGSGVRVEPEAWESAGTGTAVDVERLAEQVVDRLREGLEAELYSRSFADLG